MPNGEGTFCVNNQTMQKLVNQIKVQQNFGISNFGILNFRFYRTTVMARLQSVQINVFIAYFKPRICRAVNAGPLRFDIM